MGTPEGGANPTTPTPSENKTDITVIVFNNCLYPTPPARLDPIVVQPEDFVETLRKIIAEKLGYTTTAFSISLNSKKVPADKENLPLKEWLKPGCKAPVYIDRMPGSKVRLTVNTESSTCVLSKS
jgi:hypothetical protein